MTPLLSASSIYFYSPTLDLTEIGNKTYFQCNVFSFDLFMIMLLIKTMLYYDLVSLVTLCTYYTEFIIFHNLRYEINKVYIWRRKNLSVYKLDPLQQWISVTCFIGRMLRIQQILIFHVLNSVLSKKTHYLSHFFGFQTCQQILATYILIDETNEIIKIL